MVHRDMSLRNVWQYVRLMIIAMLKTVYDKICKINGYEVKYT